MGFAGRLRVLWKHSHHFQVDILLQQDRFIHDSIKDFNINSNWLITVVYGYPHHHLQKTLGNIKDMHLYPWIIIGDLHEISSPDEKLSAYQI